MSLLKLPNIHAQHIQVFLMIKLLHELKDRAGGHHELELTVLLEDFMEEAYKDLNSFLSKRLLLPQTLLISIWLCSCSFIFHSRN